MRLRTVFFLMVGWAFVVTIGSVVGIQAAKACSPKSNLHLSKMHIEAILLDLSENYKFLDNGGIGQFKMLATNKYQVSVLREGNVDHFVYSLSLGADCKVKILEKKESTETKG